jgi:L-iditol 2-dehydrogenase
MKGVLKFAPGSGNVELREMPEPEPGPGQVKIAVEAAGICGTDIHIHDGEYPCSPPVILGHEMAGRVVETGSGVTTFGPGDRVTALPFAVTCGRCRYCRQGELAFCPERKSFGSGVHGAFAPYLVVPHSVVRRLPDQLDFESGALSEPVACCTKSLLERSHIRLGDAALVLGPGPLGLLALQILKAQGAKVVLVGTGEDGERLALGRELGADYALVAGHDDIQGILAQLTDGLGVDVAVECAGAPPATRMAVQLLRKQGQLVQMGLHGRPFELDLGQVVLKDINVIGSFGSSSSSWDAALRLMAEGVIRVKPLIGAIVSLADWSKGFEMVRRRQSLKVILRPS